MPFSTITSKGQVTVPKEVRKRLGLNRGDRVSFSIGAKGTVILTRASLKASDVFGMLSGRKKRRSMSVEAMDKKVGEGFRKGDL